MRNLLLLMKFILIFLLGFFSADVFANQTVFQSNIDHSEVTFRIKFLELSEVRGHFESFKTQFDFDPKTKILKNLKVSIEASSINTQNKKRDLHLNRHDFFHTKKYPEIFFESLNQVVLDSSKQVQGNLTIKNKTLPIKIKVKYLGERIDTWGKVNHFFQFEGVINRKDYEINWNKTLDAGGFVLGDIVSLAGQIQAQPQGSKTAFSRFLIPDTKQIRQREKISRGEIELIEQKEDFLALKNVVKNEKKQIKVPTEKIALSPKTHQSSTQSAEDLNSWQIIGYLVVGFYGFIGAIALALLIQYFNRKEKVNESGWKIFMKESLTDSMSIMIIVPYALAMWTYMFF